MVLGCATRVTGTKEEWQRGQTPKTSSSGAMRWTRRAVTLPCGAVRVVVRVCDVCVQSVHWCVCVVRSVGDGGRKGGGETRCSLK